MFKRFTLGIIGLSLAASVAVAQQPKEQEFKLTVTGSDLQLIDKGMSALPYKDAAPFFMKLQQQINMQMQANKPVEAPKPADTDKDK